MEPQSNYPRPEPSSTSRFGLGTRLTGCGCLAFISLVLFGMIFGSAMGDYIGPAEGAAADSRAKGQTMLLSLLGIGACTLLGIWLCTAKRPRDPQ